ncbi:MAG: type II toxin-antitoxin system prevent-host-death family antitoxin [Acidobacteriota bacterium]
MIIDIDVAKTQLPELIRRALDRERIVIARAGEPLVELRPYRELKHRVGGIWTGKVRMDGDFDEPLDGLEYEIYGGGALAKDSTSRRAE